MNLRALSSNRYKVNWGSIESFENAESRYRLATLIERVTGYCRVTVTHPFLGAPIAERVAKRSSTKNALENSWEQERDRHRPLSNRSRSIKTSPSLIYWTIWTDCGFAEKTSFHPFDFFVVVSSARLPESSDFEHRKLRLSDCLPSIREPTFLLVTTYTSYLLSTLSRTFADRFDVNLLCGNLSSCIGLREFFST